MSHFSKIFNRVPIKVPNRSGFDKSCERIGSATTGTLIPVLCDEILPNTTIRLGALAQVQLPPMATDFFGRIDAKLEAFFVPGRLLFGGFEDVFTHETGDTSGLPSGTTLVNYIPGATLTSQAGTDPNSVLKLGSLADYLGIKIDSNPNSTILSAEIDNILPFMCYHLIWSSWYRDARIQIDPFGKRSAYYNTPSDAFTNRVAFLPYLSDVGTFGNNSRVLYDNSSASAGTFEFLDSVSLFSLRQRNFGKDRFTNATALPQAGAPSTLTFAVNNNVGAFTIPSLRAANALQQWLEMNNIAGARYGDQQKAEFGVYPESFKCDRPIYLGSKSISVYNRSVYKTTSAEDGANLSSSDMLNPYKEIGMKASDPMGYGDGMLVDNFRATERGYLMVMFSLVPHAYYSTGVDPMFWRYRVGDFAHPLMQGVGDEPIFREEVGEAAAVYSRANLNTFGYTQRYSAYKYKEDTVSGLLRDYGDLTSFALKRSFVALGTVISTSFLQIPTNFLNQVASAANSISSFGCWYDIYFNYKAAMPLSAYTIPTLGNMEDTHTEVINAAGTRL